MNDLFVPQQKIQVTAPQEQNLQEEQIPAITFFTHAILVRDLNYDVLKVVAKKHNIGILKCNADREFVRYKTIPKELRSTVFACFDWNWNTIRELAEQIDFHADGQFFKPIWYALPTKKLPGPVFIKKQIMVLGLAAEDGILKPVIEKNYITFEFIKANEFIEQQAEAKGLNIHTSEIIRSARKLKL